MNSFYNPCGKIFVVAVRKMTLFHSFLFPYCYYYLKYNNFIYYSLSFSKVRFLLCVLPVKKVC